MRWFFLFCPLRIGGNVLLRKKTLGLLLLIFNFTVFSFSQGEDKNLAAGDVVVPRKIDLIPIPMVKLPHAVESVSWNADCSLFAYSENKNITIRRASDYSLPQTIISDIPINSQDFAGVTASDDRSNQLVTFTTVFSSVVFLKSGRPLSVSLMKIM